MKAEKAIEILKNKPIFYSRIGFFHHPVVLENVDIIIHLTSIMCNNNILTFVNYILIFTFLDQ